LVTLSPALLFAIRLAQTGFIKRGSNEEVFVKRSYLGSTTLAVCVLSAAAFAACSSSDDSGGSNGGSGGHGGAQGGSAGRGGSAGHAGSAVSGGGSSAAGEGGASATGSVARGDYIVNHVAACGDCHTPRKADGSPDLDLFLAGNPAFADLDPTSATKGLVPTPNLTPDADTGLGSWTDEQIKTAFLDGLDADNKPLFSIMPYYVFHNMTDEDANSVVLYLRSIPAVKHAIPERQDLGFPVMQAQPVPAASLPDTTLAKADPNYAKAQAGKYLAANIGICLECHTEHVMGAVPLNLDKLFAGNETFSRDALGLPPAFPATIYSANITPVSGGIKGWAPSDVSRTLLMGVDMGGAPLCPPMPVGPNGAFGGLTAEDALAIGYYITTLPPIDNGVIPWCSPPMGMGAGGEGGASSTGGASAGGAGGGQ
jgi:mono/diheme cytochrome c family protein